MIKVLAIDDEPLALKQLATYIQKIPFFELIGECQSAHEAKVIIDEENVDAIFCDINMPDLNGMDFVKSLSAPPIIVFTTAYSEYAIESYKVNELTICLNRSDWTTLNGLPIRLKSNTIWNIKQKH